MKGENHSDCVRPRSESEHRCLRTGDLIDSGQETAPFYRTHVEKEKMSK